MRKLATLLAVAAALLVLVPAPSRALLRSSATTATAVSSAAAAAPIEIGHIPECLEAVPAAVAVPGDPVTLDVTVLLDGVTSARATHIMNVAASSYSPLGIALRYGFQTVGFGTDSASGIIEAAKSHFGGARPAGSDVVLVLTSKDIQDGGNTAVAGLADCIGGVAFPENAFAVAEVTVPDAGSPIGPLVLGYEMPAKIAAHEIGHLMGAHHHYANCVEGIGADDLSGDTGPCTLMSNFVDFQGRNFSTLEGAVVRGHATDYARP
jgi:hypothetical protein